jgi:hypothetical protein
MSYNRHGPHGGIWRGNKLFSAFIRLQIPYLHCKEIIEVRVLCGDDDGDERSTALILIILT